MPSFTEIAFRFVVRTSHYVQCLPHLSFSAVSRPTLGFRRFQRTPIFRRGNRTPHFRRTVRPPLVSVVSVYPTPDFRRFRTPHPGFPSFPTYSDFTRWRSHPSFPSYGSTPLVSVVSVRPTPDFRRSFRSPKPLLTVPVLHPRVLQNGFADDLRIFDESILQMNTARAPFVDFLDLDDAEKRLFLQDISEPAN